MNSFRNTWAEHGQWGTCPRKLDVVAKERMCACWQPQSNKCALVGRVAFSSLCVSDSLSSSLVRIFIHLCCHLLVVIKYLTWEIDGETVETVSDFIFWGSKITADGDCSHEIKRRLLLGRKGMTNLDSIFKSRDITLPTKVRLVKAMVFPVVMYGCESWTVKKAER